VIKRGEYGAILFRRDCHFMAPGYLLEDVFDPTGAGIASPRFHRLPGGQESSFQTAISMSRSCGAR